MGTNGPVDAIPAPPLAAVCLVRDVMFAGKITVAAAGLGVAVRIVRDPAALADVDAARLIVDLNQPGARDAAVDWQARTGRPVTGFVAHVDTDLIAAARAAGIDHVVARSAFVRLLPTLLDAGRL